MSLFTYEQIAANFNLWQEYVDQDATMSQEEFDAMTIEQKVNLQIEAFGPQA
jgi:hypothetical protein